MKADTQAAGSMRSDGYVVFNSSELRKAAMEAQREVLVLLSALFGDEVDLAPAFRSAHNAGVDKYLRIVRALPRLRCIRNLAYINDLSEFLRATLGYDCPMEPSEMVVHIQGDHLRIPGGYFGTMPHQDMTAFGDVPKLTTVWIPIVDVDVDTFPLELAVGRHREGILRNVPANQVYEIAPDALEDEAFVPIPAPLGSAILFDGFMPHRSGAGKTGAFRLAFSYRVVEASNAGFFAGGYTYSNPGAKKT